MTKWPVLVQVQSMPAAEKVILAWFGSSEEKQQTHPPVIAPAKLLTIINYTNSMGFTPKVTLFTSQRLALEEKFSMAPILF